MSNQNNGKIKPSNIPKTSDPRLNSTSTKGADSNKNEKR